MIKKICQFLGSAAAFCTLAAAIAIALGLSKGPYVAATPAFSGPEALNDVRRSARSNLSLIKKAAQPRLVIKRTTIETVTHIWNQRPRRLKLRAVQSLDAITFDAILSFRLLGEDWTHTSSITAAPGAGPLKPRLKLGALPIPTPIWTAAVHYFQPFGIAAEDIDAQLMNITALMASNTAWHIRLRDGAQALNLLKSIAAQSAPNGPFDRPKEAAMAPYWDRLQSYNTGDKARVKSYDVSIIFADVFSLVEDRSAPRNIWQESLAGLLALSAALSPPQIVTLWAPKLKNQGWQVVLSKGETPGKPAKTLIAPIWARSKLANRQDLSFHLAVSIALDMIAGADDMQYAGLLKEISDDAEGGSGFDPNDILANSLGQALTSEITNAGETDAAKIANCLAQRIHDVFPSAAELEYPDGPIWSQTPAGSLKNTLDFKPAADALVAIFQQRIRRCAANS